MFTEFPESHTLQIINGHIFHFQGIRLWHWFSSIEALLIKYCFYFFFFFPFNIVRIIWKKKKKKEVKRWFDHVYTHLHNETTSERRIFKLPDKGMVQFSSWKLKLNKIKLEICYKSLSLKVRTTCLGCIFHPLKPLTQEKPLSLSKTYTSGQPKIPCTIIGSSEYDIMAWVRQKILLDTLIDLMLLIIRSCVYRLFSLLWLYNSNNRSTEWFRLERTPVSHSVYSPCLSSST